MLENQPPMENTTPLFFGLLIFFIAFVWAFRFINLPGSLYRRALDWHEMGSGASGTELAFIPASHARVIDKPGYTCVREDFLPDWRDLVVKARETPGVISTTPKAPSCPSPNTSSRRGFRSLRPFRRHPYSGE